MELYQAIILGVVQGITEFLPISSSGHLLIPQIVFGWQEQGIVFDVAVHIATLLAIVLYFRVRIYTLATALFSTTPSYDRMIARAVVLSIIPVGIIGASDRLTSWFRDTPEMIGWSFIIWGIVLGLADWYGRHNTRTEREVKKTDIIWMSLAQVLALIPGTSRSGITMTAGLFAGLSKRAAAEMSFFMAIPVIAAAGFKQLLDVPALTITDWGSVSMGFIAAFLSALLGIWGLLRLIERAGYLPFVVYRVMLGAIILLFFV
jgi:undecaprenyl-diphosphatase